MLNLARGEKDYILQGVDQGIRNDGRGRLDYRFLSIESGVLQQANGSARVSILDSATTVLASVKVEIVTPEELNEGGFVEVSVEMSTSISRDLEGRGAEAINVEYTQALHRILVDAGVIDLKDLTIVEGKYVWGVYIDVLVLDSGGNVFDNIVLAAYTALCNTKIPTVKIIPGETLKETDFDIVDDPAAYTALDVSNVPLCVTLSKIGSRFVVDTSLEEEVCVQAKLAISVKRNGGITGIQKNGYDSIDVNSTYSMLNWARQISDIIFKKVDDAILLEKSREPAEITDSIFEKIGLFA